MANIEASEASDWAWVIGFVAGGLVGSLAGYYIAQKKYRAEKEKEISDVVSFYKEWEIKRDEKDPPTMNPTEGPTEDISPEDAPYPISQQEYVEDSDFGKETVEYYTDGVLADPFDRMMIIEETIGKEALLHFDEEEEDISYARNPRLGIDYEIIREHKSFASLMGDDYINSDLNGEVENDYYDDEPEEK